MACCACCARVDVEEYEGATDITVYKDTDEVCLVEGLPARIAKKRFDVQLEKHRDGDVVGLELNSDHDAALEVLHIKEKGLVKSLNDRMPEDRRIREGFFITRVNDKVGNVKDMFQELKMAKSLRLEVAPAMEVLVHIEKGSKRLGMDLHYEDMEKNAYINEMNHAMQTGANKVQASKQASQAAEKATGSEMLVVKALGDGAVQEHNQSAKEHEVIQQWDRIKAVNGIRATPRDLVKLMQEHASLDLVISRPMPRG